MAHGIFRTNGWVHLIWPATLMTIAAGPADGLAQGPAAGSPAVPSTLVPPPVAPATVAVAEPDPGDRERDLESRLLEMERTNRQLTERLEAAEAKHEQQMRELLDRVEAIDRPASGGPSGGAASGSSGGGASSGSGGAATGGGSGGGGGTPSSPVPSYGISGSNNDPRFPLKARFGPGFELITEDEEYQLQIHQETQFDAREFDPNGDEYARSGFVFPRVRLFFNGRATKPIEYAVSLNRGFSGLDILDAFVNFNYDERAQLKVGRFMTPFNYEQFAIQNMWLFAPERSLFTANLGLNRQLGVQFWGIGFDKRLDYAVGVFDGPRNSFEDYNEAKDVMAYVNARPFWETEKGGLLRDLNLGGSFTYGDQDNPLVPRAFRTASNASNASAADLFSPPFLVLDPDARERGQRAFWSAHAAYYYKSFSAFADYNGGILRYAPTRDAPASIDVPVHGFSVAMGYFLTGETQERRTILVPKRPFRLKDGKFGPGAWEMIFRYSAADFDRSVFDEGLSDPNLWSNRVWATNLGMNWYLNRYVKVYFDWQHTEFGDPVIFRQPNFKQLTNQLFWIRLQLYF